jgi:DNA invertase Pin-like site-specific DNA recombinase
MRAAIYSRVSTRDKGQDTTNQLMQLRDYCVGKGWQVEHEYQDHETASGKKNRPYFEEMFADAKAGKFDVLLFWSLDRFSREGVYETIHKLRELDSYGVRFVSLQEQYLDTLGAFREAVIGILAAVAKLERQRISERVKAGLDRAKRQGKQLGRPNAIQDVQTLKEMKTRGFSVKQIADVFQVSRQTVLRRFKALG